MDSGEEWLFVYGTLRRGFDCPMAKWLAAHAAFETTASLTGQLYDVGSYPAFSPGSDPLTIVTGDLFLLPRSQQLLRKLDRYEGIGPGQRQPYEYRRKLLSVKRADGNWQEAWVYVYAWPVTGLRKITGGDYLKWCRQR